ncbi:MAG TPA: STAS domain-containing protein [Acidimicrobiia bacterium]|nr:STAS domain-containing protein [Acidimicrobiia bacterium]
MADWDVMFDRLEDQEGRPVLAVAGEIDLAVAARLAQELETLVERAAPAGVVDLSSVGFMDSSGVRELLKGKRAAELQSKVLVLRTPSEACRHVLKVSGAWTEFVIEDAP